jgi:GNAT superfamily N-acetyltransferase
VELRRATERDVASIAALHAESWRVSYRGVYRDEYLDHGVDGERLALWTERFASPDPRAVTILAEEDGELIGFAHTILEDDPVFGALLDNLHVTPARKRGGLGRRLMAATAEAVIERSPGQPLYLWVLERNVAAQAFYGALGGEPADRETTEAPGGGPIVGIRYVWPDPSVLLTP